MLTPHGSLRPLARFLALSIALLSCPSILDDTKTWTGAVSANWSDAGNWAGGEPGAAVRLGPRCRGFGRLRDHQLVGPFPGSASVFPF